MNLDARRFAFVFTDVVRMLEVSFNKQSVPMLGLTYTQFRALNLIVLRDGIAQSTLTYMLDVSAVSTSRLIERMVCRGLAERRNHPRDRRENVILPTADALAILEQARDIDAEVTAQALANLSDSEVGQLSVALKKVRDSLVPLAFSQRYRTPDRYGHAGARANM